MKTIGLIGGVTWESTKEYYRVINEEVKRRLGGWHAGRIILYSFNFADIIALQHAGKLDELRNLLTDTAVKLAQAGANCLVICANTMHRFVEPVEQASGLPVIHIADATAEAIKAQNLKTVALLGTRPTMEEDFIKSRYTARHGLKLLIPDDKSRPVINDIIYNELAQGIFNDSSHDKFIEIINGLISKGAEGVILGCTEIPLIIEQSDVSVPVFDTAELHAKAAVDWALR